ncbi:MAG TPA: rRNA maturation RNase YbeY [Bacteroidales bacterium]|nr:rRNA maturation RNase YbeY [Bacteroidales bacterium]
MELQFFNEDIDFSLPNQNDLKSWIIAAIKNENYIPGNINFIFTSNKYLLNLNKQHLSHNYFTDIITFNDVQGSTINGDIFISIETVENNSSRFGVSFESELSRVMIHGILHLVGYDDQTEAQKSEMRKKENDYLDRFKNLF